MTNPVAKIAPLTFEGLLTYGKAALRLAVFLSPIFVVAVRATMELNSKMDALAINQAAHHEALTKLTTDMELRPTMQMVGEKIEAKIDSTLMRLGIMESLAELKQGAASNREALKEIRDALRK